jgi:hypothetical protein
MVCDEAKQREELAMYCGTLRPLRVSFVMMVGNGMPPQMVEAGIRTMLAERGMSDRTVASVRVMEITEEGEKP